MYGKEDTIANSHVNHVIIDMMHSHVLYCMCMFCNGYCNFCRLNNTYKYVFKNGLKI